MIGDSEIHLSRSLFQSSSMLVLTVCTCMHAVCTGTTASGSIQYYSDSNCTKPGNHTPGNRTAGPPSSPSSVPPPGGSGGGVTGNCAGQKPCQQVSSGIFCCGSSTSSINGMITCDKTTVNPFGGTTVSSDTTNPGYTVSKSTNLQILQVAA